MDSSTEIILIEDNSSDADLIRRALRKKNLANNIIHLSDGQEALDYFDEQHMQVPPAPYAAQIILLDLKMPKVSGIEVLSHIKSDDRRKNIPVVILTSSQEDPDVAECYRLGANSYVVKPVVFDDFMKAVSEIGTYWLQVNQPLKQL